MFEDLKYVIFNYNEVNTIDFAQVWEDSSTTLRLSLDGIKTLVKYTGAQPSSVTALTSKSQEYTHDQILSILDTDEWVNTNEVIED